MGMLAIWHAGSKAHLCSAVLLEHDPQIPKAVPTLGLQLPKTAQYQRLQASVVRMRSHMPQKLHDELQSVWGTPAQQIRPNPVCRRSTCLCD